MLAVSVGAPLLATALPTVTSVTPLVSATGVSRTGPLIVTFSEPMIPGATSAFFVDPNRGMVSALPAWNANYMRLTNTPIGSLSAGTVIYWSVDGYGNTGPLSGGITDGYFTTAADPGTCTNTVGSITLAKGAFYQQNSGAAPVLNSANPYAFVACSAVACSNWTTTNISLALPTPKGTTNIPAETIPGRYNLTALFSTAAGLENTFPDGNYVFNLQGPTQVVGLPLAFPITLGFPLPAPHVTNYVAAQAINPTQPFVLGWDAAPAGVDCIYAEIYGAFSTAALGQPQALSGAARTVTVPANTLASNRVYTAALTFYDLVLVTNDYVKLAYRATTTEFSLGTLGTPLVITNTGCSGGIFGFDVLSAAGQALAIETTTNPACGYWTTLLTTNSPGRIRVTDSLTPSKPHLFYRARRQAP